MLYKKNSNITSVKIFGKKFVEQNINNCFLILNDCKLKRLSEFIELDDMKNMKVCKITLIETNEIRDMSYMFSDCSLLLSLQDNSFFDTSNVINMNNMFSGCLSLNNVEIISKWNISNVMLLICMECLMVVLQLFLFQKF